MRRIPDELLERMAELVSTEDRDEMAIPSYLHSNALMRWMAWRRVEEVARLIRDSLPHRNGSGDATIMDFGCGTGVLFEEIASRANKVIGVDLVLKPAQLLVDEWQLDNVTLMHPDEARTELPAHSLDAIVAAEVLEHIDPLGSTIAFFRNRLKPNGKLLVSVPTENFAYRVGRRMAGFEDHYHESNAAAIHREILGNGFREIGMSRIPAPGPLAIYWVVAYQPQ
jgi:2-polyprenyl-3-methyl-5-hydroxy-6-metoxy-1,4-benzoquinol methylase